MIISSGMMNNHTNVAAEGLLPGVAGRGLQLEGCQAMHYDNALVAAKLRRWEKYLERYRLPDWEDIPDIGLYMEQVVALITDYIDYLPPELQDERVITAPAINNYVRAKVMPRPRKKKYYRVHIAYLIMISTLKQGLSISLISKLIPNGISEDEVREIYTAYVARHSLASKYFISQVRIVAGPILEHDDISDLGTDKADELIASSAVVGGLARLLAEKLVLLEGLTLADVADDQIRPAMASGTASEGETGEGDEPTGGEPGEDAGEKMRVG